MSKCKCKSYLYWHKKTIEKGKRLLEAAEEFAKAAEKCRKHKCKINTKNNPKPQEPK